MDWKSKFHSIVKETEENLAKAKEKLSGRATTSSPNTYSKRLGSQKQTVLTGLSGLSYPYSHQTSPIPAIDPDPFLNMNGASSIQVLHMQDQIDSQNKTIEKLQRLVCSLDSERDYYKEQISHLKGEVEGLTERMSSQMALARSDRHVSSVRQEVMREIEKLKLGLHLQSRQSQRLAIVGSSPRSDLDLWTVKERLADGMETVRHELSLMNNRIDRMEGQLAKHPIDSQSKDPVEEILNRSYSGVHSERTPRLYSPLSPQDLDSTGNLDILQLKQTILSVKNKLDNLESKIDYQRGTQTHLDNMTSDLGNLCHSSVLRSSRDNYRPLASTFRTRYSLDSDAPINHSANNLSDLSDLSDDDVLSDDVDEEFEELITSTVRFPSTSVRSSLFKSTPRQKGKVDFDLSDLDLSDVEEVDIDTDSLDLNN